MRPKINIRIEVDYFKTDYKIEYLKFMFEKKNGMRVWGIFAVVLTLLCMSSCREDENMPTSQEFENLKEYVEACESAHLDASYFTEASYDAYVQALEAARKALKAGGKDDDKYVALLAALQDARRALTLIDWVLITDYLPQCSMLMVLSDDGLPQEIADDDRLGAFAGDNCVGLASPALQPNGHRYFFLQILQDCADEYNTDIRIVLKYYSASANAVYLSNEIEYEDQRIWGSYSNPYKLEWQ